MNDRPGWAKPFIAMYANSPIVTLILDDTLEIRWENKAAKRGGSLIRQLNWDDCLVRAKQNGLLPCLQEGKPFALADPLLFHPPVHFVFQPQMDESGLLQGVLVHVFQAVGASSPGWRESMYQPSNIFNHQFRAPLSQIFSVLNLLQTEYQKDEILQKYLGNINWYCYRILRTVINFSMDNRIQSGQLKPKMLAGDLCRFMRILCRDTAELLQNAGYHFVYEVPDEPFVSLYDGDLLSCAICNLISNACKFTSPEAGGLISLKMAIWEKQVIITITDNGSGMKPQVLKRAFERFYSFDPETEAPCGDGLGLFICRFLLQLHHGTLALQTKEREGTTAALTLPMAKPGGNAVFYDDPVSLARDRFSNLYVILSDAIPPEV